MSANYQGPATVENPSPDQVKETLLDTVAPFCINCKHCTAHGANPSDGLNYTCEVVRFESRDLVTGQHESRSATCWAARMGKQCGPEGKLFEAK